MKNMITILTLLFMVVLQGYSQKIEDISISINSEAIGFPFTNYFPIHPGFELRTTLRSRDKKMSTHKVNAVVGAFFHERLENSFYIGAEYQYRLNLFDNKIGIDFPAGLGYLHTFYPTELYEQNDAGDFNKVSQLGRSHLYINMGIGITYTKPSKIKPFIRQELFVETPFGNGIPVIPHSILKIGVNIKIKNHEKD